MKILIDSSVWIDYFREGRKSRDLDILIDQNLVYTNDLILTEIIPFLKLKQQTKLISLMKKISKIDINIDWKKVMKYQYTCLKKGINKVGISDLIILDNVIQNNLKIYSFDKHFELISKYIKFLRWNVSI